MSSFELPELFRQWANDVLVWIGFGTVVGLLAKAIMPGRDPGGAVATVLMGIGGTVIGSGSLLFFSDRLRVTPLSPVGFVVAIAGAFVLLGFYRLLSGRLIREAGDGPLSSFYRRGRARRRVSVIEDE